MESYEIAMAHPEIVQDIQARVAKLRATFPGEVQQAWDATQARKTAPKDAGALPRPAPVQ